MKTHASMIRATAFANRLELFRLALGGAGERGQSLDLSALDPVERGGEQFDPRGRGHVGVGGFGQQPVRRLGGRARAHRLAAVGRLSA